jgi:hypothetical protein
MPERAENAAGCVPSWSEFFASIGIPPIIITRVHRHLSAPISAIYTCCNTFGPYQPTIVPVRENQLNEQSVMFADLPADAFRRQT